MQKPYQPGTVLQVFSTLDGDVLLSANETADVLGIKVPALINWVRRGIGPIPIQIGGSTMRFTVGSLRRYIDERIKAAGAEADKAMKLAQRVGRPYPEHTLSERTEEAA